jgi:hypothetical protein
MLSKEKIDVTKMPALMRMHRPKFALWTLALALAAALALASPAAAVEADLESFTATSSTAEAGARADIELSMTFRSGTDDETGFWNLDNPRRIVLELPPGLVGDAGRFPPCSRAAFAAEESRPDGPESCSSEAQVGMATVEGKPLFGPPQSSTNPVFLIDPGEGRPAVIGFYALGVTAVSAVSVRTGGDYGVNSTAEGITSGVSILGIDVELWGSPGSHGLPVTWRPFMTYPTRCDQPLTVTARVGIYANPEKLTVISDDLPTPVGCGDLDFTPGIDVGILNPAAEQPTGLDVDLTLPDVSDPARRSQSHLRRAVVKLPEGVTLNPSAATGLAGCNDAQIGLDNGMAPSCPEAAKIGTVEIESAALRSPMAGSVYVGTQVPGDPYRLFVAAEGEGVVLKLKGSVNADPSTGQLTATFDETPQLPFTRFSMQLKGGSRAPLATPQTCGEKTTQAQLTGWSGALAALADRSPIVTGPAGAACAAPGFSPALRVGTVSPVAGEASPLSVQIVRPDGQQYLQGVNLGLPPGLLAKLRGVPQCGDAAAAAAACPLGSRVGTATVGAGAGATPFNISGPVYLTGPYKGAPLGLAVAIRALAGPYDLGTVVVRQALRVDPTTAAVTAVSDPLPSILEGIPLRLRTIDVTIDRPGFTVNPTSCEQQRIAGTLSSTAGAIAGADIRFQVGDCASLRFEPKLSLRLKGGTKRTAHPQLRAVLRQPAGEANIDRVSVALPRSVFLEQAHIRTVCTRVQYAAGKCPAGSVYGYAKAFSPLLDQPLQGPVYLRSSDNQLPDLVASLDGQIHIDLVGRIDSVRGGIRTTFERVPDAPVSRFELAMKGGKKSLLVNSTDLCQGQHRATVKMTGQNGKRRNSAPALRTKC